MDIELILGKMKRTKHEDGEKKVFRRVHMMKVQYINT
jgi:hypothetical protein